MADKIRLPRGAANIPRDCLVYPRPIIIHDRNRDFLNALDGLVRKNPREGVSIEEALELKKKFGGSVKRQYLLDFFRRTYPLHSLTIYRGRVRLSTRELQEIDATAWRGRKTA